MSVGAVNKQTGERIPTAGMPAVDSVLSGTSTNPVQNRVVKAAFDEKADTDMVAADFNAGISYTAGNYCVQDGKLDKFKVNHSGAWSASDVDEVKITGELSALKSGLTNIDTIAVTNEHALITQYQVSAKMWGKLLIVSGFFSLDDDITGTQTTLFHVNQTVLAEAYTSVVSSTKNAFGRLKLATNGDIIADDPMSGQQWFSFTIVALTT